MIWRNILRPVFVMQELMAEVSLLETRVVRLYLFSPGRYNLTDSQ
jgi:hypothetical protein